MGYPPFTYGFIFFYIFLKIFFYCVDCILLASFRMFIAAFMSLWSSVLQCGHVHSRMSIVSSWFMWPQTWHFLLDGKYLSICINVLPYQSVLYLIIVISLYRLIFCILLDHFLFLNIPLMFRSSIPIRS